MLLELYHKVQELLSAKGPAYPTNVLSVKTDTHTDPNGRCLIRITTTHEKEALARLLPPAPKPSDLIPKKKL
jgi:hypothetical protein